MANGIYALACPIEEGASLTETGELHGWAKFWKGFFYVTDTIDNFLDDTPTKAFYEEDKKQIAIRWGIAALVVVGALAVAACVVTGGAAAGLVVLAGAAFVGTVSAGMNAASQAIGCVAEGKDIEIDPYQVMISGFSGAISGAVAFSPVGVGGQMIVNGFLGVATTYSTGGSNGDALLAGSMGIFSGWIGGAGPNWEDPTLFVKKDMVFGNGAYTQTYRYLGVRFEQSFKNVFKGVSDRFPIDGFGGFWSGFMKGTAVSNLVTNLMGVSEEPAESAFSTFKKRMYEKYKIPYDEEAIE